MEVMEAKERLTKEIKGKAKEKAQAWDEVQSMLNKEEVEEADFLQPYLHLLSPSLIEVLRYILDTIVGGNFLGSHTIYSYRAIINLVGSPPLMVNGTLLTLEHVMQRLDAIENKIATVELIEGLDRKIHNQISQYRSKVGNFLKNLKEKELIVNDSSRIGKLEDVITNLGSAFAAVQNTPNLTLKKTVKPVFVPRASGESSNKDENLKMINDHATYGLSTKDDYT
ncbi:Far1 [Hordeum vulgare]|nr:Far1 [Hordeum vulgare]